jgi:hypothetical protein
MYPLFQFPCFFTAVVGLMPRQATLSLCLSRALETFYAPARLDSFKEYFKHQNGSNKIYLPLWCSHDKFYESVPFIMHSFKDFPKFVQKSPIFGNSNSKKYLWSNALLYLRFRCYARYFYSQSHLYGKFSMFRRLLLTGFTWFDRSKLLKINPEYIIKATVMRHLAPTVSFRFRDGKPKSLLEWNFKKNLAIYLRYNSFEFKNLGFSRNFMRYMEVLLALAKNRYLGFPVQTPFWATHFYRYRGVIKRIKARKYQSAIARMNEYAATRNRRSDAKIVLRLGAVAKNRFDEELQNAYQKNEFPSTNKFIHIKNLLYRSSVDIACA